jgi:signal recognition particle subunit SRP54
MRNMGGLSALMDKMPAQIAQMAGCRPVPRARSLVVSRASSIR